MGKTEVTIMKHNNAKKLVFTITVAVLVIAFAVCAFLVVNYFIEGKQSQDNYQDLASQVDAARESTTTAPTDPASVPTTTAGETEPSETQVLEPYQVALDRNEDTVGWLKIAGTKIDYPVMQTPDDPNFYLDKDVDKKDSKRGALYAREECDINKPSDNITIYGHNMADGSMFHALGNYTNKATWEKNSLIFFDTLYEYHTYQIFAVFKTSANLGEGFSYHQFVDAENEAEFNEFVKTCKDLAFYDTGLTPKYGDKLIMLSTCEYTLDNGRLVVAAYRIS